MNRISDLWRLMRPRQWVKNSFVLTGILFANAWRDPELVKRVLLATAAFSLVASGVYIVNDLIDRPHDLNHPRKKQRPLAAQTVSVTAAVVLLIILWIAAFSLGFLVSRTVMTILLIYVVVNVAYSLHLKHVVILDVFIIASGFMLRILAGTVGVGIAPSQWLLLCGLMMALFLGFAKRRAELYAMTDDGPAGQHDRGNCDVRDPDLQPLHDEPNHNPGSPHGIINLHSAVRYLRDLPIHLFSAPAERGQRSGAANIS